MLPCRSICWQAHSLILFSKCSASFRLIVSVIIVTESALNKLPHTEFFHSFIHSVFIHVVVCASTHFSSYFWRLPHQKLKDDAAGVRKTQFCWWRQRPFGQCTNVGNIERSSRHQQPWLQVAKLKFALDQFFRRKTRSRRVSFVWGNGQTVIAFSSPFPTDTFFFSFVVPTFWHLA